MTKSLLYFVGFAAIAVWASLKWLVRPPNSH
jgi:hypothetical protein